MVPASWKQSVIIPLFKGGDKAKSYPNSYRGISLMSCFANVLEKALILRLPELKGSFPKTIHHYLERQLVVLSFLYGTMGSFINGIF